MKALSDRPGLGILFICFGVVAISVNDMLIKLLSGGYPLHEIVAVRAGVGLVITLSLAFGITRASSSASLSTPGPHATKESSNPHSGQLSASFST